MKFFQTISTISLPLLLITSLGQAQQKAGNLSGALNTANRSYISVKNKQDAAQMKKVAETSASPLQQAVEAGAAGAKKTIASLSLENEKTAKAWAQQFPAKKATLDLVSDAAAAPFPITSLAIAGKTDVDAAYSGFFAKLDKRKQQIEQLAKANNKYQEVYDKEGQAGLEKRAAAEADKTAIVREMGGAEKLKNMSEAERRAAAEEIRKKIEQDPSILAPKSADAGMQAMQQKLMKDPAYAKKFSAMSEAEKQVEMKKYMTIKPQGDPNAVYASVPKSKEHADVDKSMDIDMLMMRTQKRLEEVTSTYTRMLTAASSAIDALNADLRSWQEATTKAIPIVELGEVGHDRDPELMHAMELTAKLARYEIAKQEAALQAACWKQYQVGTGAALLEFNNFMASYTWGKGDDSQLFNGTYTDTKVANALGGYYGAVYGLGTEAAGISERAKAAQKTYESSL